MSVTEFEFVHPLIFVSVNVYVVVAVGAALGLDEAELNPDGELDQEYVLPDTAAAPRLVEVAEQIVFDAMTAAAGVATVTVTELDAEHPAELVSVTVYTVVTVGATDGLEDTEVNPEGELVHE